MPNILSVCFGLCYLYAVLCDASHRKPSKQKIIVTGIIGKKVAMTSVFQGDVAVPCTIVEVFHCRVTQIKEQAKDGYDAIQLACDEQKKSRVSKPLQGHFDKAGVPPQKKVVEFRDFHSAYREAPFALGDVVKQEDLFAEGETVDVQGVSKGGGFAGPRKLHGFAGMLKTHGHPHPNPPGSVGAGTTPGRVFRGKKMAARKGGNRVTVKNLKIVKMVNDRRFMVLKGAVPGPRGSYVILKK